MDKFWDQFFKPLNPRRAGKRVVIVVLSIMVVYSIIMVILEYVANRQ